ncbi:OmpA family protein [Akkermansiaceae bacterium]|nr:OmpA family protein [Akkermansiaceae bacterium]
MAKNFKVLAAFWLTLCSPICAQEADKSREEREKLIKLVLQLETDFGQTLRDYRVLQKDYAKLAKRPQVPDQRGKVEQLQKLLDEAAQKIREHQKLEAEARKGMKAQDNEMVALRRKVESDLAGLRKSLKEEQSALAVAQVKLSQLKALQDRTKKLEELLRDETVERSTLLGQYQVLRGEKNALIARVDELFKRASVAEVAQIKSAQRIALLEEQAGAIKTQLASRDAEIKRLETANARGGVLMADIRKAVKEQEKLKKLLASRESEMAELRKDLAAAKKKALDAPVLIKVRDDLRGKLAMAAKEQKKLTGERARLQKELAASNVGLDQSQRKMTELEGRLVKVMEKAAMAEKIGKQNKALLGERDELANKLELAVEEMLVAKNEHEVIKAELKKNVTLAQAAKKLEDTHKKLIVERDGLQKKLAQSTKELEQRQSDAKSMQVALTKATALAANAAKLGKENQELVARRDALVKEVTASKTAMTSLEGMVKSLESDLAKNRETAMAAKKLAAANKKLTGELADLRKKLTQDQGAAKSMQAALTKATALAANAAKLGKENQELVARRDALTKEVAASNSAMTTLEGKVKSMEVELNKNKEAAMVANKLTAERDDLKKKLEQATVELAQLRNGSKTMQSDLKKATELAARAAQLGKDNQELVLRRDALTKEVATSKSAMASLERKAKTLEANLAKSKDAVLAANKLAREKTALAALAKKLGAERDQLGKELKAAQTDLKAAQKTMKLAETKLTENAKLVEASKKLGKENSELSAKSMQLNQELGKARAALIKAKTGMSTAQTEMAKKIKLAESALRLTTERDRLQKTLAETKTRLARAELESKNAAAVAAEVKRLKKDYATVSARVEALEQDKERLSVEVTKKDADLKKARAGMTAKPDQQAKLAKLESEKNKLNADLAAKTADLKKVRMNLGRLHLSNASMEKQLDQLRRRMATIDPIRYAKGEADVKEQQTRVLTQVKEVLMLYPEARFEIVGHTCDLGRKAGNLKLSRERSKALLDFLVSQGVPAERLKSLGVGDSQPAVPNEDEASRRKNRRVEVHILD